MITIHSFEMGVSENSVPIKNPMVLLIIIYPYYINGYFIGNINPTFSDKPKCEMNDFPSNLNDFDGISVRRCGHL